ncbi:hypothetical protein [Myxococcus sp. RHSTA-1-4]|nr:hypothetical protein [Myxococcus sp. RHSTA-1-4]
MSEQRPLLRVEASGADAAARALQASWLTAARRPGTGGPPS